MGRTLTGAWIETSFFFSLCIAVSVAPSRVRGLKHLPRQKPDTLWCRTLTGAWIETSYGPLYGGNFGVAPSRVRGLKLIA